MVLHYSTERHKWLPVQVLLLLQPLLCLPCPVSGKRPQSLADLNVAASTLSPCVGSSCPELLLQGQMGKANRELYVAQVVNLALCLVSLLTLYASFSVTDPGVLTARGALEEGTATFHGFSLHSELLGEDGWVLLMAASSWVL